MNGTTEMSPTISEGDLSGVSFSKISMLVIPAVVALSFFLYTSKKNQKDSLGYDYVGKFSWWEPDAWIRLKFIWDAPKILREAYYKYKEDAYWIRRNDVDILMLPIKYAEEIRNFSREQLSGIDALSSNVLGPHLGVDLLAKSDLHVRVIRNYLTPNMGKVMMNANDEVRYSWDKDVPTCEDWTEVDIHEMAQWIVGRASARMFVGYPACRDDEWVRATIEYGKLIFGLTFLAHKVPKFMHSIVLPLTPGYWRVKKIVKYAYTVCRPAIKNYNEAVAMGTAEAEPFTLLGGMLKHAKNTEGEEQEIVSRQLLLSLASIHTTSMAIVFSLMELCKNPEFIEDLTAEAREMFGEDTDWARHSTTRLPKMDSFIMEIFRLHPPSTILPQRTALEEFTLSNGIRVPVGTHVGFPLGPIALDPSIFPDPNKFDPLRSYRKRVAEGLIGQSSKYMASSATEEHLVFGHGSQACPGRFFAVNEVKLVLLFFLLDFEFKQPERQLSKRLHFPFEEYYVLNPTLKLMMKKKSDSVFK